MKKLQLLACISAIAILLSSCAKEYHPDLVGHYKPNTEVAKTNATVHGKPAGEMMTPIAAHPEKEPEVNPGETAPELKALKSPTHRSTSSVKLTPKEEKKLEKVKEKIEHYATQSGKQIQPNDLSASHQQHRVSSSGDDLFLLVLLAIFIPPLAVFLYEDDITNHFWIDLLLTILFFIPGIIYALYIILAT